LVVVVVGCWWWWWWWWWRAHARESARLDQVTQLPHKI
jgi:hypothetical protein